MNGGIPFPDISPEIISFSLVGLELALRWYALAYIGGILIGWLLIHQALGNARLWPAGRVPMDRALAGDLVTLIVLGVVAGGRLGFVLFYQPAYYFKYPLEIPMVWHGGMSMHGGLIGVGIAAWVFSVRNRLPLLPLADLLALATPPGLLLGRLANFINAELWGRPTTAPWGVIFPGEMAQACGQASGVCARHPSQLYEACLEGVVLGVLLLWLAWWRGGLKYPGLLTGFFLAGYALARFMVEFVRQPDAQFVTPDNPTGFALHVGIYGMTMGQILCLPMMVAGALLIARATKMTKAAVYR